MNPSEPTPPTPSGEPLQFERAEFQSGGMNCDFCKGPITREFFQVNGRTCCPTCREKISRMGMAGSKAGRFFRALGAGVGAAIAGFLLYWVILAITGWELGLIAIVVGWMVGTAVRWGSNARGGIVYQLLAVALTYFSICASYVPSMLKEFHNETPMVINAIIAFCFSLAVPWLAGVSNILGWIIIAIGLFQAWGMNRPVAINIAGPFTITPSTPPPLSNP